MIFKTDKQPGDGFVNIARYIHIAQLPLSLLILALNAVTIAYVGGYAAPAFMLFCSIFSWIVIGYAVITGIALPKLYFKIAHLPLLGLSTIFWLSSFSYMASVLTGTATWSSSSGSGLFAGTGYTAGGYSSFCSPYDENCYAKRDLARRSARTYSEVITGINTAKAATAFGAVMFLTMAAAFVLVIVSLIVEQKGNSQPSQEYKPQQVMPQRPQQQAPAYQQQQQERAPLYQQQQERPIYQQQQPDPLYQERMPAPARYTDSYGVSPVYDVESYAGAPNNEASNVPSKYAPYGNYR